MATEVGANPVEEIGEINKYDFRTESTAVFKARKGIDAEIVNQISEKKRRKQKVYKRPSK